MAWQKDEVESVWDFPRPPRLEPAQAVLRIVHRGTVVAETRRGLRVLETSHPPVFYIPPEDVRPDLLQASAQRRSFCEFKGVAVYWNLRLGQIGGNLHGGELDNGGPDRAVLVPDVAWSYPEPTGDFAALRNHLAFYASRVDECWVDDERVQAQAGDFYGGWITSRVRGPFKGAPGTQGW